MTRVKLTLDLAKIVFVVALIAFIFVGLDWKIALLFFLYSLEFKVRL